MHVADIRPHLSAVAETTDDSPQQVKIDFKISFNWFVTRMLLLSTVSGSWTLISNLLPQKQINESFPPGYKKTDYSIFPPGLAIYVISFSELHPVFRRNTKNKLAIRQKLKHFVCSNDKTLLKFLL